MSRGVVESKAPKYEPHSSIVMKIGEARGCSVGDRVTVTLAGEVAGVSEDYSGKGLYRVDIKNYEVHKAGVNSADKARKEMREKRDA